MSRVVGLCLFFSGASLQSPLEDATALDGSKIFNLHARELGKFLRLVELGNSPLLNPVMDCDWRDS